MGCCGCNKNSLKKSLLLSSIKDPNDSIGKNENGVSSEGNQFSSTNENPINNSEINEKDINIEKQQKNNENSFQFPIYEEEAGIIDSQIRDYKV